MKRNSRSRGRSSSKKRRRSASRSVEKPDDEDMLVRMLNERASSDRHVLVSRDQLEELKHCKTLLKEITARAKYNEKQLAALQVEKSRLEKERTQLRSELQTRTSDPEDPKLPTAAIRRHLATASRLLAKHIQQLQQTKTPLAKSAKQVTQELDFATQLLTEEGRDSDLEQENLRLTEEVLQLRGEV